MSEITIEHEETAIVAQPSGQLPVAQSQTTALLNIIEGAVFADALKAAKVVTAHADGLHEHVTTDRAGRRISTFHGSMKSWLDQFSIPSQRAVQFNTPGSNHARH